MPQRLRAHSIVIILLSLYGAANAQSPAGKEEQDYSFATGLFRDKFYQSALDEFSRFLRDWPGSRHAEDAEYYAAECQYQQAYLADASESFRRFLARYPSSLNADDASFRLAEIAFRNQDYVTAFDRFVGVLKEWPEGPLAHESAYWAGESALKNNDLRQALKYYTISYEHFPAGRIRDYALFSIGYVQEKQGKLDEAQATYHTVLSGFPHSALLATTRTRIGACIFEKKDYAGTLEWIDGLSDSPDSDNAAERLYLRSESLYQLARFAEAEQLQRSFLAAYPAHARARQMRYALGWSCLEQQKYAEAIAAFDSLTAGHDDIAQAALFRKGVAQRLRGDTTSARATFTSILKGPADGAYIDNAHLELGMLAFQSGRPMEALAHFKVVTARYPGSDVLADAWSMSGEAYSTLGMPDSAAACFQRVTRMPGLAPVVRGDAMLRQGSSLEQAGRHAEAISVLKTFTSGYAAHPRTADAFVWLGEAYLAGGDLQHAADAYSDALAQTNAPALKQDALYGLGWALLRQQKYADAERTFRLLTTEFSGGKWDMDAHVRMGDAQFALKHFQDAAHTYQYAAKMYPDHPLAPYAMLQLGNALHRSGDTPAGIAVMREMLVRYKTSEYTDEGQYSIGMMYLQNRDFAVASGEFRKLIASYPDSRLVPYAMYSIGDCHFNAGAFTDAESAYRSVIDTYPDSPVVNDALDGIAQCLRRLGKSAEADRVRSDYLAAHPKSAVADDIAYAGAQQLLSSRRFDAAAEAFQRFLATYPASAKAQDARLALGQSYRELHRFDDAKQALHSAVAMQPASHAAIDARFELARVATDEQDADAAIAQYTDIAGMPEAAQRRAEALYERGTVRATRHDPGALRDFADAAARDSAGEFGLRARIALEKHRASTGSLDSAVASLAAIATSRTDDAGAEAQTAIGELLLDAGKLRDAEKALLRVEYVYPDAVRWIPRALLFLGTAYERDGQNDTAAATYRKLRDTYAGTPQAREAELKLEKFK